MSAWQQVCQQSDDKTSSVKLIFSDKWAPIAVAVALIGFAALEMHARKHVGPYTGVFRCLVDPDRFHNKRVLIKSAEVVSSDTVRKHGIEFRVLGVPGLKAGDHVSAIGRFHRDGFVQAETFNIQSNLLVHRALMYFISLVVLLWIVVAVTRRFRSSLSDGLFEERGSV